MANYIRTRLHIFIGLAGCSVFCLGIMMLVSGIKLKEFLHDRTDDSYQYWAGIPVGITYIHRAFHAPNPIHFDSTL
jgi:hypothetical protein